MQSQGVLGIKELYFTLTSTYGYFPIENTPRISKLSLYMFCPKVNGILCFKGIRHKFFVIERERERGREKISGD